MNNQMKLGPYTLGCIESTKDLRDYNLNSKVSMMVKLPETFEVEHSPIKNQGNVCSCVAHSVTEVIEAIKDNQIKFSTNWIYGYRPFGYYQGKGMMIRQALGTSVDVGSVLHDDFAGNSEMKEVKELVDKNINQLKAKASTNKMYAYARLRNRDEIKRAIYLTGKPVVISVNCVDPFEIDENGILQYGDKFMGYHCMVCFGWNEYGLLIQNSWGEEWGIKGTCILPDEYPYAEAWVLVDSKDAYDIVKPKAYWLRKLLQKLIDLIKTK